MPQAESNGLTLEYEEFGDSADPPILLIMGLSAQMTVWPEDFCRQLAHRGHRVIRFDNRDVGLSTWFDQCPVGDPVEAFLTFLGGGSVESPYAMADLADDAAGLLDALGLDSVHDLPPLGEFVPGAEVVEALERGLRGDIDLGDDGEPIEEPVGDDEPSVAEVLGADGSVET